MVVIPEAAAGGRVVVEVMIMMGLVIVIVFGGTFQLVLLQTGPPHSTDRPHEGRSDDQYSQDQSSTAGPHDQGGHFDHKKTAASDAKHEISSQHRKKLQERRGTRVLLGIATTQTSNHKANEKEDQTINPEAKQINSTNIQSTAFSDSNSTNSQFPSTGSSDIDPPSSTHKRKAGHPPKLPSTPLKPNKKFPSRPSKCEDDDEGRSMNDDPIFEADYFGPGSHPPHSH